MKNPDGLSGFAISNSSLPSHRSYSEDAMKTANWLAAFALLGLAVSANAQDWPQWRGPNRDAKVDGFTAPKEWPKELTKKWKITVGNGVATPALVGERLYVFTREGNNEVIRCLKVADG